MLARICALMLWLLLSACGGGGGGGGTPALGGSTTALFTTAPASVTIDIGKAAGYSISGGKPPYAVSSSDLSAVSTGLQGGTGFMISGVKGGSATVTVKDSAGAAVDVGVTVGADTALFTTAGPSVTVDVGKSAEFSVSGGKPPYSVSSSDQSSVSTSLKGSTGFMIGGMKGGSAAVTVKDSVGAEVAVVVNVKAIPLFTTASAAGPLVIGTGTSPSYTIGGGTGPYEAISSNDAVVKAVVTGNAVSVSGLAAGTATVVITDAVRTTVVLAVTVAQSGVQEMKVSPAAASANVGDVLVFAVTGGTRPYDFLVNNPSVATLTTGTPGPSSATFRMERVGTTTVVIKDAAGQFQEVTLTVTQASNQLRLSPATLQLPETYQLGAPGASTNISLIVYGGIEPIAAYTTDPQRAAAIVIGSSIYLYQGSGGTLCSDSLVTKYPLAATSVTDPTQPATQAFDVVVTVVDALGASATAKLVIIDDGLNTNPTGNCR